MSLLFVELLSNTGNSTLICLFRVLLRYLQSKILVFALDSCQNIEITRNIYVALKYLNIMWTEALIDGLAPASTGLINICILAEAKQPY